MAEGSSSAPREVPALMQAAWDSALSDPDPLVAMGATKALIELLGVWQAKLATEAMDAGATWGAIGGTVGISRQAAWERLHREVDEFRRQIKSEFKRHVKQEAREISDRHRQEIADFVEEIKRRAREARRSL
jgi:hypothetical protein